MATLESCRHSLALHLTASLTSLQELCVLSAKEMKCKNWDNNRHFLTASTQGNQFVLKLQLMKKENLREESCLLAYLYEHIVKILVSHFKIFSSYCFYES